MDLIGTKSWGRGEGHRAPFIIRFAWLSTCHESLPLLDQIPNQALYKSVQSQQALVQNQSHPQMSPDNLGFEKNLQGVLVHFIPLRNCNKLLILPICSGTSGRTEFYTEGLRHHVENALACSICHLTQSLRCSILYLCCQLLNRSLINVLIHSFSRSHSLPWSARTLTAFSSNCSLIFSLLHSFDSYSFHLSELSLFSHTVAQPSTQPLIQLLTRSLNVPHISVFFQSLNLTLTLLNHPFYRSLLLSVFHNIAF